MSYARSAVTRMTLDMSRPDLQRSETVTLGDTNRRWEVTLINGGAPFRLPPNWTAALTGIKPDGNGLQNGCSVVDGKIIYDFAAGKEIATCVGSYPVQFDVWDEVGELVASPKVYVNVLADVRPNAELDSEGQYTLIGDLIGRVNQTDADVDLLGETALAQGDDIAALKEKVTTAGTVTIHTTQWSYTTPHTAYMGFPSNTVQKGQAVLFMPLSDATKEAAAKARLSVGVDEVTDGGGDFTDYVLFVQAEEGAVPTVDLDLGYIVLRTAGDLDAMVALIGVDAYGGGTASGVDEEAVKALIDKEVPEWARAKQKPTYTPEEVKARPATWTPTAEEIGARPSTWMPTAADVGARPNTWTPTAKEVGADSAAAEIVQNHNEDGESHVDIRLDITTIRNMLAGVIGTDTGKSMRAVAALVVAEIVGDASDSFDTLEEIAAWIEAHPNDVAAMVKRITDLEAAMGGKVSKTDIINKLDSTALDKPLSAAMGKQLAGAISQINETLAGKTNVQQVSDTITAALKDYLTTAKAAELYQPKGDYLTPTAAAPIINTEVNKVVTERKEELRGDPGETPVAGKDYPTEEQVKTIIRTEVSAATAESFPKVSRIDQMTDTSKIYIKVNEGEEPYFWAYVTLRHPGSIEPDGFTDVLSTAIDQTGAIYNGCGYKNGWRVNSSGVEVELATATVTGFIACNKGDTIYMKGIKQHSANGHAIPYKSDFTKYGNPIYNNTMTENEDGTISFVAALGANTGYIRIVGLNPFAEDAVISVNNPIKYKVVEPYDYQEWRAIYPVSVTDHTADIIALQDTVNEHTNEITQLKAGVSGAVDIRVWDKPIYDTAPVVLIEGNTKPAVGDRNTVQAIYDAYDALMAAHPLYITKTAYKDKTADGQTLYRYDFQAPKPHEYSGGGNPAIVKPKIILISGIHYEMVGIWSLFHALEEIVTNPALRDIRRNAHLIVVPVCNPYCISGPYAATNNRKNANGVEIHRNFAVDHAVIDSTSNNYGGAEPLSEVETQHIDSILAANPDAVAFISCHNFDGRDASKPFGTSGGGSDYGTTFMWASTATNYLYNVGGRFGVKMSEAWENKYGEAWREQIDAIVAARKAAGLNYQPEGDYTVGMAGKSNTPGTEAKHCMLYGIQGMTFEVAGNMMALDSDNADSITITRGAEVYANLIATLLGAHDPADKKAYKYIG